MSLNNKKIKQIEDLLLDLKLDLKNQIDKIDNEILHKIDDVIILVKKLKNDSTKSDDINRFRKFSGLVG